MFGEYNLNGRRMELVRGIILEKATPSPRHCFIHQQLYRLMQAAAEPRTHVRWKEPLTFADSEPEPDLALVAGEGDDYVSAHPTTAQLVIEVADGSEELDRAKASLYAEAGIPEYWLVLPERACVEIHSAPRTGLYTRHQTHRPGDTLTSASLPNLRVELATLFRA